MRLVDLLLVLLFEGRNALPKSGMAGMASRIPGLRRMDSAGERSHRQLIDCIRSKDTDALIDAVDTGSKSSPCLQKVKPIFSHRSLYFQFDKGKTLSYDFFLFRFRSQLYG